MELTQPKVYLGGPITGLTYDRAQDWRRTVADQLRPIHCLSPLRGKEYLRSVSGGLSGTGEEYAHMGPLSLPRGVMTRDRWDATRCDVLLVNLLGATRVSIGTVMEIAWADLKRIPVVLCMEPGNIHEHMMLAEATGYRVDRLSDACDIVRSLLDVRTDPPAWDGQMDLPLEPIVPGGPGDEEVTDPVHGGKVYPSLQPERYAELTGGLPVDGEYIGLNRHAYGAILADIAASKR